MKLRSLHRPPATPVNDLWGTKRGGTPANFLAAETGDSLLEIATARTIYTAADRQ